MAPDPARFAAVDLGATSGRVMLATVVDGRVHLEQVRRFVHDALPVEGELHWNLGRLFAEVRAGLGEAEQRCRADGRGLTGIGVDTWGVDYGLLTPRGALLEDPFNYRDARTQGVPELVQGAIGAAELYRRCGLQVQPFNTIFQIVAQFHNGYDLPPTTVVNRTHCDDWDAVRRLLLMPDLFTHWLTGAEVAEVTHASTTGLLDVAARQWSAETLADLDRIWGVPAARILPGLVEPGTVLGTVLPDVVLTPAGVVAVGEHDTASAFVSVPASRPDAAFLSSGTWSLVGLELDAPVLTDEARLANFTNELGVDRTVRFLKNVMGLWVLTESVRAWERHGVPADLATLLAEAERLPALGTVVDINDESLLPPGDMPARIAALAQAGGQPVPTTPAETTRVILDSLALAYRVAVRDACRVAGRDVSVLHVVGGGSNNALLCQLTAEATGLEVVAGPAEGTALGNVLVQARALGALHGSLADLRRVAADVAELVTYRPGVLDLPAAAWDAAEARLG